MDNNCDQDIDTQFIPENVSFLDNFPDNFNDLENTLVTIKEFVAEEFGKEINSQICNKSLSRYPSIINDKQKKTNHNLASSLQNNVLHNNLSDWGLPNEIVCKYKERGIKEMFDWQVKCLGNSKLLMDNSNLVYSAPTSAGKTLVAEILMIKTVLERHKKVIVILPFVSIVREKMFYLQDILSSSGIRVEGFMGSQSPPGGLQAVHVAICTIEKANSLINRILDDGCISELGAVIVDEMHLLGDPHRGYILELLLTKIKYITSKIEGVNIQIIGMSATLPNLETLAKWLDAELFITEFRPIPLKEYSLVGNQLYNKKGNLMEVFNTSDIENDNVLHLCIETLKEGCSILIFCTTKSWCENLAQSIASSFYKLGNSTNDLGTILRKQLNSNSIYEVLEQLQNSPVGLDQVLKKTVSFGVSYHHAGLTFDERDIIEGGFKSGAIRVLVATSTLSSGVNLPARKVVIRSPVFQKQPINILTYKQMVGRAGRMGKDTKGESIIICTEAEKQIGFDLMMGVLDPVNSCIDHEDKFMRAILEVIASQVANSKLELEFYTKCTLQFNQHSVSSQDNNLLHNSLNNLKKFELIREQCDNSEIKYLATGLGKACLSSSMSPNDGLSLFCELQKARQCIVLETELHLIYLVTPYSVSNQWGNIDWLHLLTLWESLPKSMKRVGELVGVQESFIIRSLRGSNNAKQSENKLNIHKRFYTALALQDLVNEVSLSEVANKFQCPRGFLQSLQQAAATFAGMVTAFCHQLGWKNMEILFSQFQDRLHFGVHSELLELMRLPILNGIRARSLFNSGFETVSSIAVAELNLLENALYSAIPFQSEKEREGDCEEDIKKRNEMRNIWVTGYCGITIRQAAENLMIEARQYLEREIGVTDIEWKNKVLLNEFKKEPEQNVSTNSLDFFINDCPKSNKETLQISNNLRQTNNYVKVDNEQVCKSTECQLSQKFVKSDIKNKNESVLQNIKVSENAFEKEKSQETGIWDTLNISENAFQNISKLRKSDHVWSPDINNISLENTDPDRILCKRIECLKSFNESKKDISLFSSDEGGNSSLFEDSLPLDLIPSKIFDDNSFIKKEENEKASEDDNFTLFYSGDEDSSDTSKNEEILSSQEIKDANNDNKSVKKYRTTNNVPKSFKKSKLVIDEYSYCKIITIHIGKQNVKCLYLKDDDVVNYVNHLNNNVWDISLYFHYMDYGEPATLIGSKICKGNNTKSISPSISEGVALFCDLDYVVYLDLNLAERLINLFNSAFTMLLANKPNIRVLSLKHVYLKFLKKFHNKLEKLFIDVSLAEWLIDCSEEEPSLNSLAKKYIELDLTTSFINSDNKKINFGNFNHFELSCIKAWSVWNISQKQMKMLKELYPDGENVFNVEIQVSTILSNCEFYGISVDKKLASQFLIDVQTSKENLQSTAFRLNGSHFNFNSSKDVAKILGIYNGRRVSTKKSVLSAHRNPLSSIIIFWRKLNAILTKTLYPLTAKAVVNNKNNRIYPSYTMRTCSGRVSMHEPNLQSVPRTFSIPLKLLSPKDDTTNDVLEFNCRSIFKASPGHVLVSADYCQLEMRILTHYCKDEVLTKIMRSDVDVFKSVAASWGCISLDEVDEDLRQKAKQLCYGIIYGMGNRTLGQVLDVSEMEAAVFMDTFHKTYPAIKAFTSNVIESCRKKGYIETLMKRRRYLPDINSKVLARKNAAERQAVNTTIQGSAADIVKAAMVAINDAIGNDVKINQSHLILQLHDELIYEVPESRKVDFVKVLKHAMEYTVQLNVPLPVKSKSGNSWGTLEPLSI